MPQSMSEAEQMKWDPTSASEALQFCQNVGLVGKTHTSRSLHKAFRQPSEDGKMIATDALKFESNAITMAKKKTTVLSYHDLAGALGSADVAYLHKTDLFVTGGVDCSRIPEVDTFRSYNGTCNNLRFTTWGAREAPLLRLLPPAYGEMGFNEPVKKRNGKLLPGAREISNALHIDRPENDNDHSYLLMQWGQFLDHDLDLSPESPDGEDCALECNNQESPCFNIPVPDDDPIFTGAFNRECIPFVRSAPTDQQCEGYVFPREQFNEITSYIDASNVYGSDEGLADELRAFSNGRMRVSFANNLPFDFSCVRTDTCACSGTFPICFKAGDIRVSEQIFLSVMHSLWVREHNRIVDVIKRLNPGWTDERLYQETRKIIGALHQKIVYTEYLPELLGRFVFARIVPKYRGYDEFVNGGILNEFSTAAFRQGHSQLRNNLARLRDDYSTIDEITFRQAFFQPGHYIFEQGNPQNGFTDNFRPFMLGLLNRNSQQVDRFVSEELTNHLFEPVDDDGRPTGPGLDLAALNIQRSRDHGLQAYTAYAAFAVIRLCELGVPIPNPIISKENMDLILRVYTSIDQCDLWVCGIMETALELALPSSQRTGGQLGPTFSIIISSQFIRARDGDRFYYENPGVFTETQLAAINRVTIASVLCFNAKMPTIQPAGFRTPINGNERITCAKVTENNCLDISPWSGQSQVSSECTNVMLMCSIVYRAFM